MIEMHAMKSAYLTQTSLNNMVARTMVRAGWFYRSWSSRSAERDVILVLSQDWCLACDIWRELVRSDGNVVRAEQRLFQILSPNSIIAAQRLERLLALKALE